MDNAARTRQRVLALFLPIAAVLYISAEALSPKGTDQVVTDTATALKLLAIAAKHPTQLYVAGTCAVLGLGALAVSYAAIAALGQEPRFGPGHRRGADRGNRCLLRSHRQRPGLFPNLAAAATAHTTPGAAAQFLVTTFNSGFGHGFEYGRYFIGIYVAPLLMGVALWRSRAVPRWLAVLFFTSLEVAQQQDILQSGGRHPVHAAIRGRDGPAGSPDLAGSRPASEPAATGVGQRTRVTVFKGVPASCPASSPCEPGSISAVAVTRRSRRSSRSCGTATTSPTSGATIRSLLVRLRPRTLRDLRPARGAAGDIEAPAPDVGTHDCGECEVCRTGAAGQSVVWPHPFRST